MSSFSLDGIRPEQGPPLSLPMSFFFVAPVAIVGAGILLLVSADAPLTSTWAPLNVAAVHFATLGFLGAVMFGALYQMIPVVGGAPVPAARLGHAVHLGFITGLVFLLVGQGSGNTTAFWAALFVLGAALLGFWIPVAIALLRAPTKSDTMRGMRISLLGFAMVAFIGLRMVYGRAGPGYTETWNAWRTSHVGLGLLIWVGGLLASVSWQVVPMFYLAPDAPKWSRRLVLAALAVSLVLLIAAALSTTDPMLAAAAALPAGLAVWLVHPGITAIGLRRRKRRRRDMSIWFWLSGLACAPVALTLGVAAEVLDDPRLPMWFGWVALWGWAGFIMHGMLTRIVPFLAWFHHLAPLAGKVPIPPMRKLLPETRARIGWWVHTATLVVGMVAIGWPSPLVARVLALCLVVHGASLASTLIRVLRAARAARAAQPIEGGATASQ